MQIKINVSIDAHNITNVFACGFIMIEKKLVYWMLFHFVEQKTRKITKFCFLFSLCLVLKKMFGLVPTQGKVLFLYFFFENKTSSNVDRQIFNK